MVKESEPIRGSIAEDEGSVGAEAAPDSGEVDARSHSKLFSLNDKGEYCFGTDCFSMRIKPGAGEVRVVVDRNECDVDGQAVVDALFGEVVKGVPTVYESKSNKAE